MLSSQQLRKVAEMSVAEMSEHRLNFVGCPGLDLSFCCLYTHDKLNQINQVFSGIN